MKNNNEKSVIELNGRKIELNNSTIENKNLLHALSFAHSTRQRVRIFYGDIKTGRSWNEEHDVSGVISNSTGENACLILVPKITSHGGGALLDRCIIKIQTENTVLYQHEKFHVALKLEGDKIIDTLKNEVHSVSKDEKSALRLYKFLTGQNFGK